MSWLCRGWTYSVAWAETVVVAFAAGWFLHDVRAARQADDLDPPDSPLWTIVAASLLVYLTAVAWKLTGNPLSLGLGQMIHRFFGVKASGDGLDAAARLLECLVLFRAASAAAEANSEFTPALMRCLVLGATAAGFLNIQRLWEAAQRLSSPLATFFRYLATIRENVVFPDLNAAGSYFVLALFAAIALGSQRRRWLIGVFIIAVALWVTGSRAALAAGLVAGAIPLSRTIRRMDRRRTWIALTAIGLLLVSTAGVAAYLLPQRGNQPTSFVALRVRWELAKDSVRMTASHPVFGVGVGQDLPSVGRVQLGGAAAALSAGAERERAQQLPAASCGARTGRVRGVRLVVRTRERTDRRRPCANGGWTPSPGIWPAAWSRSCSRGSAGTRCSSTNRRFTFWLLLGAAAGWAGRGAPPSPLVRRFAVGACSLVLLLVPLRARTPNGESEHGACRLRSVALADRPGRRALPAVDGPKLGVPARERAHRHDPVTRRRGRPVLHVQLRLDGRDADTVVVPSDRWFESTVQLARRPSARRDSAGSISMSSDPHADGNDILMIGRVEPRALTLERRAIGR